jgi:hypothetical protein
MPQRTAPPVPPAVADWLQLTGLGFGHDIDNSSAEWCSAILAQSPESLASQSGSEHADVANSAADAAPAIQAWPGPKSYNELCYQVGRQPG